jgi:NADH-quinone oxidoreductase subunit H
MILGVYAVAVLERVACRLVAGEPVNWRHAATTPFRQAALLLVQRSARTERPDSGAWALAPALLGALAAAGMLAVPLAPGSFEVEAGIVLFGAAMALVMVAVYLHGWAPNALLPLLGGYRFVAQALSYEMPLALVLIAAALPAESLSVGAIVRSQDELWNVVRQPLGLPIYLIAALGLAFHGPLGLPDAADLAGGTEAEVSGVALLLWRIARAAVLVAVAAMGAAVFLGGWQGPWLPGPAWVAVKTLALLAVLILTGHLLARVRLERFVVVSWVILIPLALVDVFASGLLLILSDR